MKTIFILLDSWREDEIDKMEQKKFYSMIKNLYERTNIKKFKK